MALRRFVFLALGVGCAAPGPSVKVVEPHREVDAIESNSPALRVPKIVSVMPESGVVGLGPVLIRASARRTEPYFLALVVAADELGADAFLADSKRMREAYRFRPLSQKDLMDPTARPVAADDLIYHGPYAASGEPSPTKEYFYHALKFVTDEDLRCDWASEEIPSSVKADLESSSGLRSQFEVLNGAFAAGVISVNEFQALRLKCVRAL